MSEKKGGKNTEANKLRFWNFSQNNETGESELRIDGEIATEAWLGDETTPKAFSAELSKAKGNITVWINSPGGEVFAASEIYTMLRERPGRVTVKIDGLAASAASVIAMAGDKVLMSPTSMMMIHDPMSLAWGNSDDMAKAMSMLDEVKESIINAYVLKSGLPRDKISELMSDETWMSAKKAVDLGFADEMLYQDSDAPQAYAYSGRAVASAIMSAVNRKADLNADREKRLAIVAENKKFLEERNK